MGFHIAMIGAKLDWRRLLGSSLVLLVGLPLISGLFLFGCRSAPLFEAAPSATYTPSVQPSLFPTQPPIPISPHVYTIGQEQSGETINMLIGERIQLLLGDGYIWSLLFSDDRIMRILNPQPGADDAPIFILEAQHPGQTELQAIGDPKCRQVKPPCGMPSVLFTLKIIVE